MAMPLNIMNMASKLCISRLNAAYSLTRVPHRCSNTVAHKIVERHRKSKLSHTKETLDKKPSVAGPRDYKFVYPEFLPTTIWQQRDRIRENLERQDMYRRRRQIDLPEFYVGSIMAVTVSDPYSPGKKSRFIGICIQRDGHGLRAHFTLRNVIDGQGVELMYEMYSPIVQKVEVLKLEKRLDEELFYLRDAPQHYSTVPFDFEVVPHPPGMPIPVNNIKVKLGPRPWERRWERENLEGVEDLGLPQRFYDRAKEVSKPWEKHDLMKQYRESINEVETEEIMADVHQDMTELQKQKARIRKALPVDPKS